ncbi:MAG: class I SAM-dependent rRNA methyltransferase [Halieaceae bacterium]|nr:class I SAM-dependent rRNA methyltransferase [Halieaceae bacterium]
MNNPELRLRQGADRRLRHGHCWIYSNEIDTRHSPLGQFEPGDPVNVTAASGEVLASAYMEPNSLICARVVTRAPDRQFDVDHAAGRIRAALDLRERYYSDGCYRLLYGDSDGVSGIVADRYGNYLVVQLNTAGAEQYRDVLVEALVAELAPAGILLRADSRSRQEQGLESRVEVVYGEVPDTLELFENGVKFLAPAQRGQKTGWFYDHRENRARFSGQCRERRVLDVYSYIGGWGVQAAAAGAREVHCIDNSAPALEMVAENAALNQVGDRVTVHAGRADHVMRELADAGERFDAIVLDPPAFIQRKRDLGKGRKAYRRINELGLALLAPGGLLVSASCSMHLPEQDLVTAVSQAATRSACSLRLTHQGGQGADHPVHPAIPETRYLKALFCEREPADPMTAG